MSALLNQPARAEPIGGAARGATFDTLLDLGVTRFARNNPPAGEFVVTAVNDPSGFSTLTR